MLSEALAFGPGFTFSGFCYNDIPSDLTKQNRAYKHESMRAYRWLVTLSADQDRDWLVRTNLSPVSLCAGGRSRSG